MQPSQSNASRLVRRDLEITNPERQSWVGICPCQYVLAVFFAPPWIWQSPPFSMSCYAPEGVPYLDAIWFTDMHPSNRPLAVCHRQIMLCDTIVGAWISCLLHCSIPCRYFSRFVGSERLAPWLAVMKKLTMRKIFRRLCYPLMGSQYPNLVPHLPSCIVNLVIFISLNY